MNLMSALACMAVVVAFAAVANPGEKNIIIICALYSVSLLAMAIEMVRYWFQSKLLSKYSSIAALVAYVIVSAYKIYLLATAKSVYWFALSNAVEYGVTGLILILIYKKKSSQEIAFSFEIAKKIFVKSRHYVLPTLLVVIFGNAASILLKLFVGETETGYYAAAVTCTAVLQFVYTAIIDSAAPVILSSKKINKLQYEKYVSRLYGVILYMSIAQSIVFSLFSGVIIRVLFGVDYLPSVPVLRILIWQISFSFMGTVRNIWILCEGKHKLLLLINSAGAIVSLMVNAILIPIWGACGAAVASVITQVFTNFIMGFILRPMRENNMLILRGLNPKLLSEMLNEFFMATRTKKT